MRPKQGTLLLFFLASFSCTEKEPEEHYNWVPIKVTATAYNSLPSQTSQLHSEITAWGDSLKPGMKYIAVSRDLLRKGLSYNTMVQIEGFDEVYVVKDKMHHRWRNRIDIYMGLDKEAALEWGRKRVEIRYAVQVDSLAQPQTAPAIKKGRRAVRHPQKAKK